MPKSLSVHDNRVTSILIDCAQERIVFHTVYDPTNGLIEITNIVFNDVLAYHWEGDNMGTILFEVEEILFENLFPHWASFFEKRKNYGWLPFIYQNEAEVQMKLNERGIKAFCISSSCGMDGFVLAKTMTIEPSEK